LHYSLNVLVTQEAGVEFRWDGIIVRKLVQNYLIQENGRELHDNRVTEGVSIVALHISEDIVGFAEVSQLQFEINLIPNHHWWKFVGRFSRCQILLLYLNSCFLLCFDMRQTRGDR